MSFPDPSDTSRWAGAVLRAWLDGERAEVVAECLSVVVRGNTYADGTAALVRFVTLLDPMHQLDLQELLEARR